MNGDVVCLGKNIVQIGGVLDLTLDLQGGIDRQIRVVADNLHIQRNSRVGNAQTDCTQTDDAQRLACDFRTGEVGLAFFCECADLIAVSGQRLCPLIARQNLTGRHKQRAQNQLLDGVCVRTRRVEYDNTILRALFQRDVVDTGAGTCDALELLRKLDVVQLRRADQNRVVVLNILSVAELCLVQQIGARLGNLIVKLNLIHGNKLPLYSYSLSAAQRKHRLPALMRPCVQQSAYLLFFSKFSMNFSRCSTPSIGIAL